jgi:hypothetical protein
MTLTVIPTAFTCLNKGLKEIFEISNPFITADEGVVAWNQDIPVEEILGFITDYHRRLSDVIGDNVILVNFDEKHEIYSENDEFGLTEPPNKNILRFAPSLN